MQILVTSSHHISAFLLLGSWSLISCSPLAYDGLSVPIYAIPPMPMPMMLGHHHNHQFDPYAAMSSPAQYMMAPPFNMVAAAATAAAQPRRSNVGRNEKAPSDNDAKSEEQKALDGLPVSFVEPEPPSTISERLSDSFSAIGEGVRNHLRSLTENFSDTMDDIKDAWRFTDKDRGA